MSNLSDLLPSGGGQNIVDFVADGSISSGQAVALTSAGKVKAISATGNAAQLPLGSINEFDTNANKSYGTDIQFDPHNSNRVGVAFKNGSSYPAFILGTISEAGVITFGTAVVVDSVASNTGVCFAFDPLNADKIVIIYYYPTIGIRAKVGTLSGTSSSFGSADTLYSRSTSFTDDKTIRPGRIAFDLSKTSTPTFGCILYRQGDSSMAFHCGTYSGTSISAGNKVNYSANLSVNMGVDCNSDGTFVIGVRGASNLYVQVITAGISGVTPSLSSVQTVKSAEGGDGYFVTFDPNNKLKCAIAYEISSVGKCQIITLSGTGSSATITAGTEATYYNGNVSESRRFVFDKNASNGSLLVGYVEDATTDLYVAVGTYDDSDTNNTITFTANTLMHDNSAAGYPQQPFFNGGTSSGYVGFVFVLDSDNDGQVQLGQFASGNVADFIGLADAAISDTATGKINVKGSINSKQSSLTIGSDYYVQNDGSISTTSTSPAVKIGRAVTATTINMMDLT
jgi:hypothetical protein